MVNRRVGSVLPKRDLHAIFSKRAILLSTVGLGALGAIGVRLAQLQVTDVISRQYSNAADENRFDSRLIAPPRGVVYDRFGVPLAITSKDYRITITPERAKDLEGAIRTVAVVLGFDEEWVRRRARAARGERAYEPFPLRQGLTWEQFAAINVRLPELPGVTAESTEVRSYPYDVVFAHPIGYVQKPNQRDIDRAQAQEGGDRRAAYYRHPDVRVGKAGLEASLEDQLRGEAGWRKMIVNAFGREMGEDVAERREPRAGEGVVLTIDADLQRRAMEAFGDQSGAACVIDMVTGDLIVMTSAPGFDPNQFVNGIPAATFQSLNDDEMKPLFHKAVGGAYSPGSTFKMTVGIAAKQAGLPDNYRVSCPGFFQYGGRAFHCWQHKGHGSVDMHQAIQHSCDVFFYNAALFAGPERIAAVAREFGFGTKFDVNVPNVGAGVVPDPTWWRQHRNSEWTGGLTLNYGIGQGDLLVTPLQLATMAARIGSNGHGVTPRLVRDGAGARDPAPPPRLPAIDSEHLALIRGGMYSVCNDPGGTAVRAGSMINLVRRPDGRIVEASEAVPGSTPVRIAGKTGTAQVRVVTAAERARGVTAEEDLPWKLRDNALFVCFGPWDDPRYACGVVVEHGSHGSSAAAPIAAMVMRETFKRDPGRRAAARLATLEPNRRGGARA